MLRLVLDTSVIASAFRSQRGASYALLRLAAAERLRLLATTPLFLEYEDVLKRPEQRLASGFSLSDVDEILAALAVWIEPVEIYMTWRPQLRDTNDEMVLEAAINGRADMLVTFNIRDFDSSAHRFGIRLLDPAQVLQEIST